jgi:hypothetical protein
MGGLVMTAYRTVINQLLKEQLIDEKPFVLFGQNVAAGSCLSGLTRGLTTNKGLEMFNTPNCENAMVGFGFGLMMRGVDSAFFVKQHDFLLLTLDHMVNTYNMLKLSGYSAGFTIVCIVVDSGFEGPQSRLNNLSDFCSLADIDTFTINTKQDAETMIPRLKESGFRIVALSQRLFAQEMLDIEDSKILSKDMIHYLPCPKGDVLIVSMNFTVPSAYRLSKELKEHYGWTSTIVGVQNSLPKSFSELDDLLNRYDKVVILEDSRSINKSSHRLQLYIAQQYRNTTVYIQERSATIEDIVPNPDVYTVSTETVYQFFHETK